MTTSDPSAAGRACRRPLLIWYVTALTVSLLAPPVASLSAQADHQMSEPAMKAAYLLNFARYTEWPASEVAADAPLLICTTDADVAADLEAAVAGNKIGARPVVARLVKIEDPPAPCAILYVDRMDQRKAAQLLRAIGTAPVLTVSDTDGFSSWGGIIELFLTRTSRMYFVINRTAADQSRLRLSSRLLVLGRTDRN